MRKPVVLILWVTLCASLPFSQIVESARVEWQIVSVTSWTGDGNVDLESMGYTHQKHSFHARGYDFCLYGSAWRERDSNWYVDFEYRSSPDGLTWSEAYTIIENGRMGYGFSIWYDNATYTVYMAYADKPATAPNKLNFTSGTVNTDGTITFGSHTTIWDATEDYNAWANSICKLPNGYLFVGFTRRDGGTVDTERIMGKYSTDNGATWLPSPLTNAQMISPDSGDWNGCTVLPLTSDTAIYMFQSGYVYERTWNGTTLSAQKEIPERQERHEDYFYIANLTYEPPADPPSWDILEEDWDALGSWSTSGTINEISPAGQLYHKPNQANYVSTYQTGLLPADIDNFTAEWRDKIDVWGANNTGYSPVTTAYRKTYHLFWRTRYMRLNVYPDAVGFENNDGECCYSLTTNIDQWYTWRLVVSICGNYAKLYRDGVYVSQWSLGSASAGDGTVSTYDMTGTGWRGVYYASAVQTSDGKIHVVRHDINNNYHLDHWIREAGLGGNWTDYPDFVTTTSHNDAYSTTTRDGTGLITHYVDWTGGGNQTMYQVKYDGTIWGTPEALGEINDYYYCEKEIWSNYAADLEDDVPLLFWGRYTDTNNQIQTASILEIGNGDVLQILSDPINVQVVVNNVKYVTPKNITDTGDYLIAVDDIIVIVDGSRYAFLYWTVDTDDIYSAAIDVSFSASMTVTAHYREYRKRIPSTPPAPRPSPIPGELPCNFWGILITLALILGAYFVLRRIGLVGLLAVPLILVNYYIIFWQNCIYWYASLIMFVPFLAYSLYTAVRR